MRRRRSSTQASYSLSGSATSECLSNMLQQILLPSFWRRSHDFCVISNRLAAGTGAKLMTTLVHELRRRKAKALALFTLRKYQ